MNSIERYRVRQMPRILYISIIICIGCILMQCPNPDEWKPGDPQVPPPDPPEIFLPKNDTAFSGGSQIRVRFEWEELAEADIYEIETDTLTTFSTAVNVQVYGSPAEVNVARTKYLQHYYGRVRAGSPAWTWFTGWSETRHFIVMTDGLE